MIAGIKWRLGPPIQSALLLRGSLPALSLIPLSWRFGSVQRYVDSRHSLPEIAEIARAVLARAGDAGVVVECGCYKGGSTARLSLACRQAGKRLLVFDSFEGLPEPEPGDEEHQIARKRVFRRGEYTGSIDEVRANLAAHGAPEMCTLVPGWFADTMNATLGPVSVAFIDADLVGSTRDALEALWPRVVEGGVVFVHDTTDPKLCAFLQEWSKDAEPTAMSDLPTHQSWFVK